MSHIATEIHSFFDSRVGERITDGLLQAFFMVVNDPKVEAFLTSKLNQVLSPMVLRALFALVEEMAPLEEPPTPTVVVPRGPGRPPKVDTNG